MVFLPAVNHDKPFNDFIAEVTVFTDLHLFYKEPSIRLGSKNSIFLDLIWPHASTKISLIVP